MTNAMLGSASDARLVSGGSRANTCLPFCTLHGERHARFVFFGTLDHDPEDDVDHRNIQWNYICHTYDYTITDLFQIDLGVCRSAVIWGSCKNDVVLRRGL